MNNGDSLFYYKCGFITYLKNVFILPVYSISSTDSWSHTMLSEMGIIEESFQDKFLDIRNSVNLIKKSSITK